MLRCWNSDPSKRPTFPEIISSLEETYSMLKANFDPISSNSSPMYSKDFIKSDSDSGMSSVNRPKSCEVQIYADDMSDISSQPSASSGVDVFNQSKKSPSLEILHGSLEDLTASNDPWIRTDDSIQFMEGINNAIRELDEALAGEPTSSDPECSPPVVNFRLGPIASNKISRPLFGSSYNDNSYLGRRSGNESSGTDTEDEHWRLRIERGEFSEKVKQKSKSVADLMILTHIDASESSESDTPLNSLSRQNSFKNNRLAVPLLNSLTFTSDSDLRYAQDDHDFQDTLKKFQTALKNRDDDSLSYLSVQIGNSMKVKKDTKPNNTNPFLEIEASEKIKKNNPFILPNTTQCSTVANNSSVLLGPCENFTIDYYKGVTSSLTEKPVNDKLDNSIFENFSFTFNPYESMKWDSNIFDFAKPIIEGSEVTKVEGKSKTVLDDTVKESNYNILESDSGHTSDYTNCEDISTKDPLETKSLSAPNYTFNESSETYNYYNNIAVLKNGSDDSGCEIEQITSEDGSTEFLNDKSEDEDDNEITVIKVHDLYENNNLQNDQSKTDGISDEDSKQCEVKGQYEIDDIIEGLSESWYLHPPNQNASGWLPDTINHDDEIDDKQLSLDEEYAEAIRQELRGKVNQNDNDSRNLNISLEENDKEVENTDHTDMVIHYNAYPPPLSTIFEEDEDEDLEIMDTFSENPSPSCILTDTSSDHLVISREKLVDSSSELDNIQDDVLIVDTITNEAIILDTDISEKQEIKVLNNTYTIEEVNSDTDDVLENLESDSVASYSPDSLSPGSTSKTAPAVSYSSSESAEISDQFVSPTYSNIDLPLDRQTNAIKSIEELLNSPHQSSSNENLDLFDNKQSANWLKTFLNSKTFCENDLVHSTSLPNSINFNNNNWPTVNELTVMSVSEPNLTKLDVDKTIKTQAVYDADCWKSLDSNSTITEEKAHKEFQVWLVNENSEKQESQKKLPTPLSDDYVLNDKKTTSNDKNNTDNDDESTKSEDASEEDEVEFVPSTWDSNAIPSKSSLRSSNSQSVSRLCTFN